SRRQGGLQPTRSLVTGGNPPTQFARCSLSQTSAYRFEQPRRAHAATYAHGHHPVAQIAPLHLAHKVAWGARAGHAEGMAYGDGAAVDVELLIVDLQPVAAVEALRGEGFVEFPQIDVVHLQPLGLEQLGHREDRADAHFLRLAAGDGEATEERP